MGREVDLLVNYPRAKRNVDERGATKTEEDRAIARKFGKEFFDGDRKHGYGGYSYNARFWSPVMPTFQEHFGLTAESSVLDVGCAKGFMMHDMAEARHVFDVNVIGVLAASQTFLPFIREAKGRIVNLSSLSGLLAVPFMGPYSASKAAIESLSDTMRRELQPLGVEVIAIQPGTTRTQMWDKAEEIDLKPDTIEIAGYLDTYETATGYLVTPVVGFVRPGFSLKPDEFEVADVFEVPLSFIFDPANHQTGTLAVGGLQRLFHVFEYENRFIWGATAGILMNLFRRVSGEISRG